jgi:hypothetical protein
MTPDYDLSNLESAQVNLWLYLHIDDICAQIAAGRASRRAIPETAQEASLGVPAKQFVVRNETSSGKG